MSLDLRQLAKPASYPARVEAKELVERVQQSLAEGRVAVGNPPEPKARKPRTPKATTNSWSELAPALVKAAGKRQQREAEITAEAREANGLQAGITLPLRLGRGQNDRGLNPKWRQARIAKRRAAVRGLLALLKPQLEITVTRSAPSPGLDPTDNLPASMKEVIDEVAAWLGIDDGDPRVKFVPAQERGPWSVRLESKLVSQRKGKLA